MKYIKIVLSLLLLTFTFNTTTFAEGNVDSLDLDECMLIIYNLEDKESFTGRTYYNLHTVKNIYVQGDDKIKLNGEVISIDPSKMKKVLETYVDCTERD